MASTVVEGPRNRILRALDRATQNELRPMLERVTLTLRTILYDYDTPIDYVYFPENCIGSVVGVLADGTAVETATVGDEGMVGLTLYFGGDRMAAQAFCQVSGESFRMKADDFRTVMTLPRVHSILGRYTQAFLTQIAQSSACNRMHSTTQRCARWLLQTHDRVHKDELALAQEFLAQMLGVPPDAAAEAAGVLDEAESIRYRPGRITIIDRVKLELQSCECYHIVAREYGRLLDGRDMPSPLQGLQTSEHGKSTLHAPSKDESGQLTDRH
jgi:CRP-like cAMP-binding protein